MDRRDFLKAGVALPVLSRLPLWTPNGSRTTLALAARVRPGDKGWPSPSEWGTLNREVHGRLSAVPRPLDACRADPAGSQCQELFTALHNPYFIGDNPALTQTSGWVDAWSSQPGAYVVAAESAADVAASVHFARIHNLRLVVRGGAHSYQGTSDAADSLVVWTRRMNRIELHDAFVPTGMGGMEPKAAVSVGSGAMWIDVYDAVTTKGGRYVQGGGCASVGVAGLVQSGGFGSFSKRFGLAAAGLLEAEVVTADSQVRVANPSLNPDLFWALKGGGGGTFGVVTRVTLRTHELPETFGGVSMAIHAASDNAFRALLGRFAQLYRDRLFNSTWGESIKIKPDNVLEISMVCQGVSSEEAQATWKPFIDAVRAAPDDYRMASAPRIGAGAAQRWWDVDFRKSRTPGAFIADSRPGAPATHAWWQGDADQVGVFLHGFTSTWLPASLLDGNIELLRDRLFSASREWEVQLHFNKGLAGAPADVVAAARATAMNQIVAESFALALIAAGGPAAFAGLVGHEPDVSRARREAAAVARATAALRTGLTGAGSYVSESDYFERDWAHAFWGTNYPRLLAVKERYDPSGLFFVRHGVGSERWSDDGFTPIR